MTDPAAILRWYAALTVVSAGLLPVTAWLGAGLGGARFGLTRPLALALLTGVVWWPAVAVSLPFTRTTLALTLALIGIAAWALWLRHGLPGLDWRALGAFEGLWLLTFLAYAWFRGFHPDIAYTEKPMEIALLNSIARSSAAPAPDPWLAGSTINYYYFGYQMIASLVKLSGVPTAIAFNLALATVFASSATAAAAVGAALARAMRPARLATILGGALAPVLLLLAGNLETALRLARDARGTINAGWWDGVGWQASRIVVDQIAGNRAETINEFPAFSMVLGDLHPHVLAYPLLVCLAALAVGIALGDQGRELPRIVAFGGLAGLLYATNSWDAPLGLLLVVGAAGMRTRFALRVWLLAAAAAGFGALLTAAPFLATFSPPVGLASADVPSWMRDVPLLGALGRTFGIVTWRPSSVRELLIVHGAWLLLFVAFAVVALAREAGLARALRRRAVVITAFAAALLAGAIIWAPALVVIGWPLGVALILVARANDRSTRLIAGMFAVGWLLVLLPEFVYIQDAFGNRMNTVFKLYLQAWLLLSLAATGTIVWLARLAPRRALPAVAAGAALLLAVTLPYAWLSVSDWAGNFKSRQGLDGSAFIARVSPGDAAAIAWVRERAREGDTIVEAPGCSYGEYAGVPQNRVSAFTGVPTIVGWQFHEYQWRRGVAGDTWGMLNDRAAEANAILSGTATRAARSSPRFLILGRFETAPQPGCSLTVERGAETVARLTAAGWSLAFEAQGTRVFERPTSGLAAP